MQFYLIELNKAVGIWIKKYLDGKYVKVFVDSTGSIEEVKDEEADDLLENEELVELINQRFDTVQRKSSLSAVYGEPDFLPIAFLQKGIKCSAAVCRLVRFYGCSHDEYISSSQAQLSPKQDEGLIKLITELKQTNKKRSLLDMRTYNCNDLADILGIDDEEEKNTFFDAFASISIDSLSTVSDDTNVDDKLEVLKSILRRLMPMSYGTGFLVGKNYLLTNQHVLSEAEEAKEFLAQFGYEQDLFGRKKIPVDYKLDNSFFVSSDELDYTLVKLQSYHGLGEAGDNFGYLRMSKNKNTIAPPLSVEKAQKLSGLGENVKKRLNTVSIIDNKPSGLTGEPVNIIQHPKGQPKQVVLSSNRMLGITNTYLRYEADADYSSSGSPVLNQQWQLVGLHHAALYDDKYNVVGQEGVRICRVVKDLERKHVESHKAKKNLETASRVIIELIDLEGIEKAAQRISLDSQSIDEIKKTIAGRFVELANAILSQIEEAQNMSRSINLQHVREEGKTKIQNSLEEANKAVIKFNDKGFNDLVSILDELVVELEKLDFIPHAAPYEELEEWKEKLSSMTSKICYYSSGLDEFLGGYIE